MTTLAALRAYAIRRSLFPPVDLYAAICRLGFVQVDPIRAPARAQDLILRHRVAGYRCGDLERAYPSLPLAEDMLHVYGVMPLFVQRLLHPRGEPRTWRVEREQPALAQSVLRHVRKHGATHPAALQKTLGQTRTVNGWGGQSSASTRMLEALHHRGVLRVRHRDNGIKVYTLAGRRERPLAASTRARGLLALVLGLYAPLPETSLRRIARMVSASSLPEDVREVALQRLLKSGKLRRAAVEGVVYVWPADEAIDLAAPEDVRLLTPFDPVVWDRRRFEHFWGWGYRFEAYTPPDRRTMGYYALPLLWRDNVIGWANVVMRDRGLDVKLGFVRKRPAAAAFRRELDADIARLETALRPTGEAPQPVSGRALEVPASRSPATLKGSA